MSHVELKLFKNKIYDDYCEKSIKIKNTPIKIEEFSKLLDYIRSILMHMFNNEHAKAPYLCVQIDKTFQMYGAITQKNLVINIWTNKEKELILSKKKVT